MPAHLWLGTILLVLCVWASPIAAQVFPDKTVIFSDTIGNESVIYRKLDVLGTGYLRINKTGRVTVKSQFAAGNSRFAVANGGRIGIFGELLFESPYILPTLDSESSNYGRINVNEAGRLVLDGIFRNGYALITGATGLVDNQNAIIVRTDNAAPSCKEATEDCNPVTRGAFVNEGLVTNQLNGRIRSNSLILNAGSLENAGLIISDSDHFSNTFGDAKLFNTGLLTNKSQGLISNNAQLVNLDTERVLTWSGLVSSSNESGRLFNRGRIENNDGGLIINLGTLETDINGSIENDGTLVNLGELASHGSNIVIDNLLDFKLKSNFRSGIFNNDGELVNKGTAVNFGTLRNRSSGSIENDSILLNSSGVISVDTDFKYRLDLSKATDALIENRNSMRNTSGGTLLNMAAINNTGSQSSLENGGITINIGIVSVFSEYENLLGNAAKDFSISGLPMPREGQITVSNGASVINSANDSGGGILLSFGNIDVDMTSRLVNESLFVNGNAAIIDISQRTDLTTIDEDGVVLDKQTGYDDDKKKPETWTSNIRMNIAAKNRGEVVNLGVLENSSAGVLLNLGQIDNKLDGTVKNDGVVISGGGDTNYETTTAIDIEQTQDAAGNIVKKNNGKVVFTKAGKRTASLLNIEFARSVGTNLDGSNNVELINRGIINNGGSAGEGAVIINLGELENEATGTINNKGTIVNGRSLASIPQQVFDELPNFLTITEQPGLVGELTNRGTIENEGFITNEGVLSNPGQINNTDAALILNALEGEIQNTGDMVFSGASQFINAGSLINNGDIIFENSGLSLATVAPITRTLGGRIAGFGKVSADELTFTGTVAPGNSLGLLTLDASVTFSNSSTVEIEIGGHTGRGENYDAIDAQSIRIGPRATLEVLAVNGFLPELGDYYDVLVADDINGDFLFFNLAQLDAGLAWSRAVIGIDGGAESYRLTVTATAVPLPAAIWLFGFALFPLLSRRKRCTEINWVRIR